MKLRDSIQVSPGQVNEFYPGAQSTSFSIQPALLNDLHAMIVYASMNEITLGSVVPDLRVSCLINSLWIRQSQLGAYLLSGAYNI